MRRLATLTTEGQSVDRIAIHDGRVPGTIGLDRVKLIWMS
jgi:hypothetical protein